MALYASANGLPLVDARICLPRVGAWYADVAVAHDEALAGPVTLELGGVQFKGTVRRGGMSSGVSVARVVGGGAGLNKVAAAQGYSNVPISVPLTDVLNLAGETLSSTSGPSITGHQLKHWVRAQGQLGLALGALAAATPIVEPSWRVLADGTVWVGEEGWPDSDMDAVLIEDDPRLGRKVLYAEKPSVLPGTSLDGSKVGYVEHVLTNAALRTEVWVE
jgi:hypothetical protein